MPSKNFTFGRSLPGTIAVPFFLILSGIVLLMDNFGMVILRQAGDLWPLLLITAAVEELVSPSGMI